MESKSETTSELDEHEVTRLLEAWRHGDAAAQERLFTLVYEELRRLADRVRGSRSADTLSATALVHEAHLRLSAGTDIQWDSRAHFFRVAAKVMRHIRIDRARARNSGKRGGGVAPLPLDEAELRDGALSPDALLSLDAALTTLEQTHPRWARVVELRFFAGLGIDDTARILGLAPITVSRDWRTAKTWLYAELGESQ